MRCAPFELVVALARRSSKGSELARVSPAAVLVVVVTSLLFKVQESLRLQFQISDLKSQISDFKSQISSLKFKFQISNYFPCKRLNACLIRSATSPSPANSSPRRNASPAPIASPASSYAIPTP